MIRLAICDDHELVREALVAVLESFDDISVVGAAESLESLIEVMDSTAPDVVLVDVRLGAESGIDAARHIHDAYPTAKIVMLTSFGGDQVLVDSVDLGASAFVLKSGRPQELAETIRKVVDGIVLFDSDIVDTARERLKALHDNDL